MTQGRSIVELLESRRLLSAGNVDYSFGDLGTPLSFSNGTRRAAM